MDDQLDILELRASPATLYFDEYNENEVRYAKEGAEDSDLWPYINDETVRVGESPQFNYPILLKKVENKRHETVDDYYREIAFALLFDELGFGNREIFPNVHFATRIDGNLHYGMEFKSAGMPYYDLSPNNFDQALDYIEEAGEDMGILRWLGVQHGDLIQMNSPGLPKEIPTPKNILFHANNPEAVIIDPEDASWSDDQVRKEPHKSGIMEMNTITAEGEYMAVRNGLLATTIFANDNILDFFDQICEIDLRKDGKPNRRLVTRYDPGRKEGLNDETVPVPDNVEAKVVDLDKLIETEEEVRGGRNERLRSLIKEMESTYTTGFEAGVNEAYRGDMNQSAIGSQPFLENIINESDVPTNLTFEEVKEEGISQTARKRWDEIYDFLNENI